LDFRFQVGQGQQLTIKRIQHQRRTGISRRLKASSLILFPFDELTKTSDGDDLRRKKGWPPAPRPRFGRLQLIRPNINSRNNDHSNFSICSRDGTHHMFSIIVDALDCRSSIFLGRNGHFNLFIRCRDVRFLIRN